MVDATDPGENAGTPQTKPKKVRLACQRCRDRRIKCDGQTPSCSKCAKAGVDCIDVGNGSGIPRAFLTDAQARLQWLEEIVRTQLPSVDLNAGPPASEPQVLRKPTRTFVDLSRDSPPGATTQRTAADNDRPSVGEKRAADHVASYGSASIPKRARRMATDIGLFSLSPGAGQAQYLGTSSGSLFADLLQNNLRAETNGNFAGDSDNASDIEPDPIIDIREESLLRQTAKSPSKSLSELLPQRQQCDRMIRLFFNYYHADYPVLHQPSFLTLVDAIYACAECPIDGPLQYNGWPTSIAAFRYNDEVAVLSNGKEGITVPFTTGLCHLCFVLSIAANLQMRKRVFTSDPKRFAAQALASLQVSLGHVSLSSVQSMVLFVLNSFLSPSGGRIWIVLHVAMSYAIDLGLQRDLSSSARLSHTMLQMRRRVFLTLYTLDRFVSTIQGRPISFEDPTLDLTAPGFVASEHETEATRRDQAFLPYSAAHSLWASIVTELKHCFYRLLPEEESLAATITQIQDRFQQRLDQWLQHSMISMKSIRTTDQARLTTQLRIDYNFAIGLLYQPSRLCPRPDADALRRCFESARRRIRLFDAVYHQNDLSLSWPTTHGVFLAGATLIYCIWTSSEIRSTVSVSEVAADLRSCSNLLTLGGEWWPLAQRGRQSFEKLTDATLECLMSRSSSSTAPPPQLYRDTVPAIPSRDEGAVALGEHEWMDVEAVLQSFLQNELQFPDLLDTFEPSTVHPADLAFDTMNWHDSNMGLPE